MYVPMYVLLLYNNIEQNERGHMKNSNVFETLAPSTISFIICSSTLVF
jgi:hypothetical protein